MKGDRSREDGNDHLHSHNDVKFNNCLPASSDPYHYLIYQTMVHQAGHTLGLSAFTLAYQITPYGQYVSSHPTIGDSVMNLWNYTVTEPDCSPHPFDIMALHALYRAVR